MMWSYEAFTSRDVIRLPSWNFTPWRTLNVYVRLSGEIVHDSARSPMNFVPVRSVGSTRISVLYWGAPGCSIAKVSSRWASKLGGSAATTKTSSPPERGLSWALAGVTSWGSNNSSSNGRMVKRLMTGPPDKRSAGTVPCETTKQGGGSRVRDTSLRSHRGLRHHRRSSHGGAGGQGRLDRFPLPALLRLAVGVRRTPRRRARRPLPDRAAARRGDAQAALSARYQRPPHSLPRG